MSTIKTKLYAASTLVTFSGLIVAMGAPVKWGALVWPLDLPWF